MSCRIADRTRLASAPLAVPSLAAHDAAIDQRSPLVRALARVNECQLIMTTDERRAADGWLFKLSNEQTLKFIEVTEGKSAEEIKLFTLEQIAAG